MIFMLENNNRRIICRMAKSSVKKNSGRNWILFLAILLASFMLFSIFTVGITYFKMYRIQNIRLNGGDYDAVLYGITEEQREKCEADPEISRAGIVALSGYIESTEGDDTVEASCIWADSVYWDEIMSPAREWVRGAYPEKENEVMATEEGLEKAGLSGLGIGDTFTAGYRDGNGRLQNREFTISGLWDGYGVKSAFYVSEAFYRASGCDISEVMCGRYHLKFDKPIMTFGEQNDFIESLNLGKQQALYFTGNMGYSLPIFCGLCGLVLVTCLCVTTLLESQGARTIVTNHMDNDLTIVNDTLKKEDAKEHKDLLTESFLDDLKSVSGVAEIYPLSYGQITVPWEPDFAEMWMEETYAKWMNIPYEKEREEYKEHPENFGAVMIGISEEEFPYLQQTVETEIDREDFLEGKTCVIYRNDLDLTSEEVVGKDVTCGEYGNGDNQRTFRIAGMTDEGYYMGPMLGLPPTVIVSDRTLEGFLENHFVAKVGVKYAETYNEETENGVLRLIKEDPEADGFSWESKLESMKEVESAQGNMKEVGTGISLILALIGILNYVNTVTGNIQSRKTELAILESVGMTDRQRNRMLVTEGLIFAVGSLLITATAGLAVTYAVYQSMNYMQVPFVVPVWPAAGMAVFIAAVCAGIPVIAGAGMVHKGSVVERVRGV